MGLIHSRASKQRDRAAAKLAEDELRQRKIERRREQAADNPLLQPTAGDMFRVLRQRRSKKDSE